MLTFGLQTISLISLDLLAIESDHCPLSATRHNYRSGPNMANTAHFLESGLREKVIEHLFVGDLLRSLWCQGSRDIEVLRAEVDRAGYDLVLESNGVLRHVQLKASYRSAKTARVGININLARKPSGCVLWIWFDPDTMDLGPFLWFGGQPGEPLPSLGDRVGKHTKGDRTGLKAERPNIRILAKGRFSVLATMDDVTQALFGAASPG
jgi:hypothetical protein